MQDAIYGCRKDEHIERGQCRLLYGQGGELHIAQGRAADDQSDDREEEVDSFFRFHRLASRVVAGFGFYPAD